jgi:hypothetical protein
MNDLLNLAVEAHGGLKRWSQLTTVKASVSITGKLWQLKAQPEALKDLVVEAQLKRQQLTTHLIGTNRRSVFTPDRVSIESESGILDEGRDDPRSAFQGQRLETPWDNLHLAYYPCSPPAGSSPKAEKSSACERPLILPQQLELFFLMVCPGLRPELLCLTRREKATLDVPFGDCVTLEEQRGPKPSTNYSL